jgi:hypothetical protein
MNFDDLKHDATLVMQHRLTQVLKEVVADTCINHSCCLEIDAIHKLWSMLNLEWIDAPDPVK